MTAAPPTELRDVRVAGLRKSFGDLRVLDGIDITVQPGESYAVLGPSGCGKSTLLRVLAGFEQADAGTVRIAGEEVTGPSPSHGMVSQSGSLFPWLTLRDNLGFGPKESGRTKDEVDQIVDELLVATGLDGFAGALPRELSGGMGQRAAIAQVLANRPPVLLLDEPFGALDAQTRLRMHEWLRSLLAGRDTTCLIVTHDVDEALLLADRVGLLSARPATVVEELVVPFGRDRGRRTLTEPEFVRLKAEVLERVLIG
ncbi:MAG TPA: ABC transporter ATP-binding protein [Actinomycetales bacterium]|nr:ABC transporter ATP-binding protein [Actinomycetales bacterium]